MAREAQSRANADINPISEQSIIAAILRKPDLFNVVKVRINDFADPRLQVIYQAMADLSNEGVEIDLVTLGAHLMEKDRLEEAGGPGFIAMIDENKACTDITWQYHQDIVISNSIRRQLGSLATQIKNDLTNNNIQINDYLQTVNDKLTNLTGYHSNSSNLSKEVKEWCLSSSGIFNITDLYRDLGIAKQKNNEDEYRRTTKAITVIMGRLVKQNIIEKVGSKRGQYRLLDQELEEIDFRNDDRTRTIDLRLPLNLHELVYTYPKNIIIVAGESNAGKTAFLLETIYLNDQHLDIEYFSCEGGKQELRQRLQAFDRPFPEWRFLAWERFEDFGDVIKPNKINMIDFLEVDQEFYLVGQKIKKIHQRLDQGIAIIALQKDEKKKLAVGGQFSKHKSRLYISMGKNEITLEKAKNPINPTWKLDGKKIKFALQGPHFVNLNPRNNYDNI